MDLPELDPQLDLIYTFKGLLRALKVSRGTLYKYVKLVGIEPYRKNMSRTYYYSHEQALELMQAIYTPQRVFKLMQKARREARESR